MRTNRDLQTSYLEYLEMWITVHVCVWLTLKYEQVKGKISADQ